VQETATAGNINWQFDYADDPLARLQTHWTRSMWQSFRAHVPNGARVLEIGCGSGRLTVLAARDCAAHCVGLDITVDATRYARLVARAAGVEAGIVRGDGLRLPFADGSFDCVLSDGVIEHFGRRIPMIVQEHARVCRPGGRVVISTPNLFHLLLTYHKWRTGPRFLAYPERSFTRPGLARLLRNAGLRPVAYSGFTPSAPFEWFLPGHPSRLRRIDDWFGAGWLSWIGYQVIVVAEKPG
jgi:2-polyprenyl-3-methyl-5-hydroxy-6-metoxy-1,4-benzoquinol methylase